MLNGGGFTLSGTVATAGSATLKNISLTNAISVAAGKTLTLEEGVRLSEISLWQRRNGRTCGGTRG